MFVTNDGILDAEMSSELLMLLNVLEGKPMTREPSFESDDELSI